MKAELINKTIIDYNKRHNAKLELLVGYGSGFAFICDDIQQYTWFLFQFSSSDAEKMGEIVQRKTVKSSRSPRESYLFYFPGIELS